VPEAKVGARVQDGKTAASAVGGEMATTGGTLGFALDRIFRFSLGDVRKIGGARLSGFESHILFLSGNGGVRPSVAMKSVRNELRAKGLTNGRDVDGWRKRLKLKGLEEDGR